MEQTTRYTNIRIQPDPEPGFIVKAFDNMMNMERTLSFFNTKKEAEEYINKLIKLGLTSSDEIILTSRC